MTVTLKLSQAFSIQEQITFKQIKIEDGLSQSSVYCMLQDSKGYLWFGTANGLNRYDGYDFKIFSNDPIDSSSISDNGILALYEDRGGNIWIGTTDGVLNKFNDKTGNFSRYYLTGPPNLLESLDEKYYDFPIPFSRNNDNTITSITEGPDNSLWIGTWGKGLIRFNPKNNFIKHYYSDLFNPNGLHSNRVKEIVVDGKYVWIGTLGGGLYRMSSDDDFNKMTNYTYDNKNKFSLGDNQVISLIKGHNGDLWIGTYSGGLNRLPAMEKLKQANETKFIHYVNQPGKNSLSNNVVTALMQDRKGNLWIGTYGGGLDVLDLSSGNFTNFQSDPKSSTSLSKNDILSIMQDASGIIWIGTHLGKGLNKLESSVEKFKHVARSSTLGKGLNDDVVWAVSNQT